MGKTDNRRNIGSRGISVGEGREGSLREFFSGAGFLLLQECEEVFGGSYNAVNTLILLPKMKSAQVMI